MAKSTTVTTTDSNPAADAGGVDLRVSENSREPVEPYREGSKPMTPASGALPNSDRGRSEPVDEGKIAAERQEARSRVEMRKVIILRGYQPLSGPMLKEGAEVELAIEEARFLEESGIAQSVDTYRKGQ